MPERHIIPPARVVLVDQTGEPLRLISYQPVAPPIAVEVGPLRALALTADFIEGARRRLERQAQRELGE